jgi:hypothetical protein
VTASNGSTPPACPCEAGCDEIPILNPSGLPTIAYRVGDFVSFRRALVRHLAEEQQLAAWRPRPADEPGGTGDLGMQIVDWWSYLGDILTFYNERIANQDYLGTADLPGSVSRLVALLGYRPRPGIGATATLAVVANRPQRLVLPAGFQVGSKAAPGQQSQVFELSAPVTFDLPTSAPVPAPAGSGPPAGRPSPPAGAPAGTAVPSPPSDLVVNNSLLVQGSPAPLRAGDNLLLIHRNWTTPSDPWAAVTVVGLTVERSPDGRTNTRVSLQGLPGSVPANAAASDYQLLRSRASTLPFPSNTGASATTASPPQIVLDATARWLSPGDPLLVEVPSAGAGGGTAASIVALGGYSEVMLTAPGSSATPPLQLLVAVLAVIGNVPTALTATSPNGVVRSQWVDLGPLLPTPVTTVSGGVPPAVTLGAPPAAPAGTPTAALIEDSQGRGAAVEATPAAGDPTTLALAPSPGTGTGAASSGSSPVPFIPPLRLLWDLISVSRGKTVAAETLGLGDATIGGQDFTLSQSPVTYLSDPASRSGEGYSSTVQVTVGGIRWSEVPSLYGRGPEATVFVTSEDDAGQTHVRFGDGADGRRPATGAQVTATYRVGGGSAVPGAGGLSVILSPVPNLSSVRNPVPASGGADPDPPQKIRSDAPRSVLTFGRAISADDYQVVALQAPGVDRASAVLSFDPLQQRAVVRVYVTAAAVASARAVLLAEADPNRPVDVRPAVARPCSLRLTVGIGADADPAAVTAGVRTALLDPETGLFSPSALGIGQALYRSQIEAACCAVAGVRSLPVANFEVRPVIPLAWLWWTALPFRQTGPRYDPGEGGWFDLDPVDLIVATETSGV